MKIIGIKIFGFNFELKIWIIQTEKINKNIPKSGCFKRIEIIVKKINIFKNNDASFFVLRRDSNKFTGKFYIDEEVLTEEGITDLEKYSVKTGEKLFTDLYLD